MPVTLRRSVEVGGKTLGLEDVCHVAEERTPVSLAKSAAKNVDRASAMVQKLLDSGNEPHYGINTGFGSLKGIKIPKDKVRTLQTNLIRSHAVGVGPALPVEAVRAMMLLRAHTLALGHSGVRRDVIEKLLSLLNADIVPVVPSQGSVGASGDLAPLAHLALGLIGEGEVWVRGERHTAGGALRKAKIEPLRPEAKEALALLNGTQMMTALGVLSLLRSENALRHADIAAAMTLEATLGSPKAYDERIHKLRPHPGQMTSAANLRKLTAQSEIYDSHRDCGRVQDAYSIRCAPQVHGAARDQLVQVRATLEREVDSVTDNPILFPDTEEAISAGNFHGQPVATMLDVLAMALTPVASISERRTFRLLDPALSGMEPGLVHEAGLNSGFMMLQVTAAALVSECKTLSHPASVDSIPTWANQEDHVSMGAFAARKAVEVVTALERVLAIEFICAAQGLEYRRPLKPAKGVLAAWNALRKTVKPLEEDRYLAEDIATVHEMIQKRTILDAVEEKIGSLQ